MKSGKLFPLHQWFHISWNYAYFTYAGLTIGSWHDLTSSMANSNLNLCHLNSAPDQYLAEITRGIVAWPDMEPDLLKLVSQISTFWGQNCEFLAKVNKTGSICFRGFCVLELFLRKETVIKTILINIFVFSVVFVTFVLRALKSVQSVWSVVTRSFSSLSCWGY